MDFTPLSLINIDSRNVRIRVRIARSWDFINPRNSNQIFSHDLLLIDDQGDTIHASISAEFAEKFRPLLLEGKVYHISGFTVLAAQPNYRISTHQFRLRIPYNTYIKEISEDAHDIPYDTFNFLTFDEVAERVGMIDYALDTYGMIARLGNLERVRALDQIKLKRSIFIEDSSGVEIEVTLWDKIAVTFPEDDIVARSENKPVGLAIVAVVAKAFNDGFSLNSTAGTKFFINPEIPEITALLAAVNKPCPFLHKTQPLLDDGVDIEDERTTNRKTIVELLQLDIHTDKGIKFTCTATIKSVDTEEGWWYRACPRCKGSIQNLDDKLWCKNCRFIDSLPIPWYRVRLIVEDKSGTAIFVLFGRMAADLIGVPAQTLAASFKDRYETPPMFTKFFGLEKTFQLQLPNIVDDPEKISFKILFIFKDNTTPVKKEIPSPASTRSTHLTLPLAKPICSPPAKRALQFDTIAVPPNPPAPITAPTRKRTREHAATSSAK